MNIKKSLKRHSARRPPYLCILSAILAFICLSFAGCSMPDFDSILHPPPEVEEPISHEIQTYVPGSGDINGDGEADIRDVREILLFVFSKKTLTKEQIAAADVDGDGVVTATDALAILPQEELSGNELANFNIY